MSHWDESLGIFFFRNARFFAADLFFNSFATAFPVPRENAGLSIQTPPENWWQQVALYKWSESEIETVGFCNWIRYSDCYLCGGLCVRTHFYRRLPKEHWTVCQERGGIAQILLEAAARQLTDCVALAGYCGDKKAYLAGMRSGFQPTRHRYVIMNWRAELTEARKRELEESIAAIGAF